MHYNKEAQMMNSASINYTQGYLYPNTYKTGDSGGSRDAYGCGGSRGAFSDCGAGHGGGGSGRGHGGGRFANFQCQICLKFGHTANVCHFRFDVTFHPQESLTFFDPTTLPEVVAALLMFSAKSATNMGMKHHIVIIVMMITMFPLSLSLILRINTPIQTSTQNSTPNNTSKPANQTPHPIPIIPILHQTNLTLTIHTFLLCLRSTILHQIKPCQTLPTPILFLF